MVSKDGTGSTLRSVGGSESVNSLVLVVAVPEA